MGAAAFLTVLHPGQARELLAGPRVRRGLRPKRKPLSPKYIAGLLGALAVGLGLPYAEEVLRCGRAALRRRAEGAATRTPTPPAPELAAAEPGVLMPPPRTGVPRPHPGEVGAAVSSIDPPGHAVD